MSRYYDGDDDEQFPNAWALYANAARLALKGKRGKAVLTDLREALRNLPEKRLIARAMCTVGPDKRTPQPIELPAVAAESDELRAAYVKADAYERREFEELIEEQGQGVCAIGAYLWWQKVKAGSDPAAAFSELPTLADTDNDLSATAQLANAEAKMAFSLAWQLAYRNDETFENCTPEERYERFLAWIDAELGAETAVQS